MSARIVVSRIVLPLVAASLLASPVLAKPGPEALAARAGISGNADVGTLLADPRAQAALKRYAPQVAADPRQMKAVKQMNAGQLEAMARDLLPADLLAKLEAKARGR